MSEQVHDTCDPIRPGDIPDEIVDAAQRYDLENRGRGSWTRVPEHQLRRLLAGALTAASEQIAQAVEARCIDPDWPNDEISTNGRLAADVVRSWPEDLDA